jgi:hypothetical protein
MKTSGKATRPRISTEESIKEDFIASMSGHHAGDDVTEEIASEYSEHFDSVSASQSNLRGSVKKVQFDL